MLTNGAPDGRASQQGGHDNVGAADIAIGDGGIVGKVVLDLSAYLCEPPVQTDEQETPIAQKFRRFSLDSVTGKLEQPPYDKHRQGAAPDPGEPGTDGKA